MPSRPRLHARGWALLFCSATAAGCVVTTFEGPGEPPRVAAPPPLPGGSAAPANSEGFGDSFAEAPVQNEDKIRARHLLVQYAGSKRAPKSLKRSRDEAFARATEALGRAKAGEDFAGLVREFSDEPGAADRGGDLGRFDRQSMVKPFADAAFALEVNAISDVVETEFGFHVIQRTE
ncbi:MAG TPA: peptidylprolyl isomerase [Polyangiaceae bacterium]